MSGVLDVARNAYRSVRRRLAPAHTMRGHTEPVDAVAFFKDNRRIVTGSWDCTLRIWDVQKGVLVGGPFEFEGHGVRSVAVSPDERQIASGGYDKSIIIWDVESKQKVFNPLVKHTGWVKSVCFSPNGKRLASGSDDKTVVLWDAETGAVLATLDGHRDWVHDVAFSPDGLKLASGSSDNTIQIWRTDSDKPELLLKINAHQYAVLSVVWSPEGHQLLSVSFDTVKFWNSSNGELVGQTCTGHTDRINSLAIFSDGSFITTASDDKTVRLWSTKTHQQIGQALRHPSEVHCIAISSSGELLVSGSNDGKARLWFPKNILEQYNAGENMKEDEEEAWQKHLLYRNNMQPPVCDDSSGNRLSETHEAPGGDDKHSLSDILTKNTTIRAACLIGDLHAAEYLLNREIDADDNHHLYASRSVVRARNSEWDNALQDAVKSIAIQPSLLGYISKGIALCGNQKLWHGMEVFDLASTFANRDPITIDVLLLIKAVALFNASRHDEAMRRVRDLTTASQHSDALLCSVVDSYLHVQHAIAAFEDGRYIESADRLSDSIPSISHLLSCRTLFELRLETFTVLFGWDLDSLWQTVNQRRCEAFFCADRVVEAAEAYEYIVRMINESAETSCLEWSSAFKKRCIARCVSKGDEAVTTSNHDIAIGLYSTGIRLDSSCDFLFAQRSKAMSAKCFYAEALQDAQKVIELNPSSYLGYELKHAALHGDRRYDEAIEAYKIMLLKLEGTPDAQTRKLRSQYVSPSEVEDTIRRAVHAHLENAPLRALNTFTGRLCDRQAQINTFMESTECKELLSSPMKDPHLQTELIKQAVVKYFNWVMLSHRWENGEPLLHDIQDKVVYDLDPIGTNVKLQTFCRIARDAGYRWAWSDTCCIDQKNNVELQESVNSMFIWYRHSALTIVYLSDVSPSSKFGALANSVWNTRGWTVQEFLAPKIVLFYQNNWSLYLDNRSPNHKQSVVIMRELENSTGIDARALIAFRPGMSGAREKLRWASSRITTLQEDIAYSLFGIFGVHLPVIYGEKKQDALGRLLEAIVAQSGDVTALDWVGKSSEFNSCLPAEITAYKSPPCMLPYPLSEAEMQASVSSLRNVVAVESASSLYARLDNLSAPRFATRRLQLPCIAFVVREVRRRHGQDRETCFTYDVKADGLQDLSITTEDKLIQFSPARPTPQAFFFIRPWNRHDSGLPDFADDANSIVTWSEPMSYFDESVSGYSRENEAVDSESHSRALRLIVRLGQPFGALLLAQQRGGEFKRIASDHNIIAQVKDVTVVRDMMDIRTLEIL